MEYRLEELFDLQMGKTPSRSVTEYWESGNNKWISIADLSKCGKYIYDTKECLSDIAVSESGIKQIPANTVVMSFKLSIGKTAITSEPMYSNEAIMSFRDRKLVQLLPEYIYYLLLSKNWDDGTNKAVMGKTLNKATLSKVKVNIHSMQEQQEIVYVLNQATALIELHQQQLQKLDELVKARFVELFGDPISNPHGFDKVDLSELADIKIGPFGSLLHKGDYIEGGYALLNPSHIIDGKIAPDSELTVSREKYEELSAYHLKAGDVVMGRRGEMGRCAVVPCDGYLCGTGSLLIRTKGDVTADYIQKIISFPSFKKAIEDMAVGQTMPNLNVPIVSRFQIIKPPIEVQHSYYAFVEQTDKSKLQVPSGNALCIRYPIFYRNNIFERSIKC